MPAQTLGPVLRPMIAVAVAIILFEGGLSLDFRVRAPTCPSPVVARFSSYNALASMPPRSSSHDAHRDE